MAFRELSFAEMEQVAGGHWQSYSYYSSGYASGRTPVYGREWVSDDPQTTATPDQISYATPSGPVAAPAFDVFASDPNADSAGLDQTGMTGNSLYESAGGGGGGFIDSLIQGGGGTFGPTSPGPSSHAMEEINSFFSAVLSGYSSVSDALANAGQYLQSIGVSSEGQQYFNDWAGSAANGGSAYGANSVSSMNTDIIVNGYQVHYDINGYHLTDVNSMGVSDILASSPGAAPVSSTSPNTMSDNDKLIVVGAETSHLTSDLQNLLNQNGGHYNVTFNYEDPQTHQITTAQYDLANVLPVIQSYSVIIDNSDPKNGGVGSAIASSDGSFHTSIQSAGLSGYLTSRATVDTLILHEVSHLTGLGQNYNAVMQTQWGNKDTFPNTSYWVNNEVFANSLAQAIGNAIGDPIRSNPTVGFQYVPLGN